MLQRAHDEDVTLTWSNPVSTARIYLRMTTGVGTHGGFAHAEIECERPDAGALTLPGDFLDVLYSEGWGCDERGTNDFKRYHATQQQAGMLEVQLRTESRISFFFRP